MCTDPSNPSIWSGVSVIGGRGIPRNKMQHEQHLRHGQSCLRSLADNLSAVPDVCTVTHLGHRPCLSDSVGKCVLLWTSEALARLTLSAVGSPRVPGHGVFSLDTQRSFLAHACHADVSCLPRSRPVKQGAASGLVNVCPVYETIITWRRLA